LVHLFLWNLSYLLAHEAFGIGKVVIQVEPRKECIVNLVFNLDEVVQLPPIPLALLDLIVKGYHKVGFFNN